MKGALSNMKGPLLKTAARLAVVAVAVMLFASSPLTTVARQAQTAHADAEVERGRQLHQRGDSEGAAEVLRPAAERLKTDADAWLYLGLALFADGKAKEARKAFEKSVKLRPDSAFARANLAVTLLQEYKSREAEREARHAIKLDPGLALAHYALGVLRHREERFEEAVASADAALRANPNMNAAAYLKAEALLALYWEASARFAEKRPFKPEQTKEERAALAAERAAALEPIKARMREAAATLETLVKSGSGASVSDEVMDAIDSLKVYGSERRPGFADASGIVSGGDVIRRARIISKPEPGYTAEARQVCAGGTVRLRAVLGADGKVRNVMPIKRLTHGLTEKAVEAARQIKFEPAQKDGRAVSQYIVLEYNFSCR